jgi:hypothetical protein
MFTEQNIRTRLANGEDAGVIANEFAAMVNSLLEERRNASKREEALNNIAATMADAMFQYFEIVAPELADAIADEDIDMDKMVRDTLDSITELLKSFNVQELVNCGGGCDSCGDVCPGTTKAKRTIDTMTDKDADASLEHFLTMLGL